MKGLKEMEEEAEDKIGETDDDKLQKVLEAALGEAAKEEPDETANLTHEQFLQLEAERRSGRAPEMKN